jgi:hypothetical protein
VRGASRTLRGERAGHDGISVGGTGIDPAGTSKSAGGSSHPSTPPKVGGGRKVKRGSGGLRRSPAFPVDPGIGVHAVGSIARSRTQERCLCRLPGRTVRCCSRLGGPPSSEGRGDRRGKRCRLRSAEAAQRPGPPGVGAAGSRAVRLGRGVPVTGGRPGRLGGSESGGRRSRCRVVASAWEARPVTRGSPVTRGIGSGSGGRHTGRVRSQEPESGVP